MLNPTVEIPELMILIVCESPSVPPPGNIVHIPVAVILWSCAALKAIWTTSFETV